VRWRVIPLQVHDGFINMALDEAIGENIAAGSTPTIRFYRWKPSAVSIGYFQSLEDEVDLVECDRLGVDYVRRRTGGGAVYHDFDGEITYSLLAPQDMYGPDIPASYREICGCLVKSLAILGLEAEFSPVNDVLVDGKKISGSAQTRRDGVLLQHGTLLHRVDPEVMFGLLRAGEEKMRDKFVTSVKSRVTSVVDQLGQVEMEEVYRALLAGFTEGKTWDYGEIAPGELERARILAIERYRSREWNFSR
jgi:lipoate-protein ligase A